MSPGKSRSLASLRDDKGETITAREEKKRAGFGPALGRVAESLAEARGT